MKKPKKQKNADQDVIDLLQYLNDAVNIDENSKEWTVFIKKYKINKRKEMKKNDKDWIF